MFDITKEDLWTYSAMPIRVASNFPTFKGITFGATKMSAVSSPPSPKVFR